MNAASTMQSRRQLTLGLVLAGATVGLSPPQAASACRDLFIDPVCTYKCEITCNEQAPNNNAYCRDTCKDYCTPSQEKVSKLVSSAGGKMIQEARKGNFDGS